MNLLKATGELFRFLVRRPQPRTQDGTLLDELQVLLGYRFKDAALLSQSLTHKSSINPETTSWLDSNERLEFLGDAVLDCLVTEHLYLCHPRKSEGQLSKIKSLIVSRKILGEIALAMDLGKYLYLGISERKAGGRKRNSVLANAFEAVLGAMYLDGGLECSRIFLQKYLYCRIDEFVNDDDNVNYKSGILELSQRDGFGIPRYEVLETSGPDHAKEFRVRILIAGVPLGEGTGSSKKVAQQQAALIASGAYNKEYILKTINGESQDELLSD